MKNWNRLMNSGEGSGEEVSDKVLGELSKKWVELELGEDKEGYDEKMKEVEKNKKKYFGDWLY